MNNTDGFKETLEGVLNGVPDQLKGLTPDDLVWQPGKDANPIGWLVWHTSRAIDSLSSPLAGQPTAWDEGWREKFNLPYGKDEGGTDQTAEQVAAFTVSDTQLLVDYFHAAVEKWNAALVTLADADLEQVFDTQWLIPPLPLRTILAIIVSHALQHLGQVAYVKGLWENK